MMSWRVDRNILWYLSRVYKVIEMLIIVIGECVNSTIAKNNDKGPSADEVRQDNNGNNITIKKA